MRFRWLVLPLFLVSGLLPLLFSQEPDGPPSVRNDRTRARLAARGSWQVAAKLYNLNDAATAARDDLLAMLKARLPDFTLAGEPAAVKKYRADFLNKLAKEFRYYRYLTSYNFPTAMRREVFLSTSFLINSLSRHDEIRVPAAGGPGNILIRIDLRHYDISTHDWDEMGLTDPYFHQDIEKVEKELVQPGPPPRPQPQGPARAIIVIASRAGAKIFIDGQPTSMGDRDVRRFDTPELRPGQAYHYQARSTWEEGGTTFTAQATVVVRAGQETQVNLREPGDRGFVRPAGPVRAPPPEPPVRPDIEQHSRLRKTGKLVRTVAGWIDPAVNADLIFLTQSKAPILRADWWLVSASVPPFYYKLLRLKSLQDFRDLAGFDERAEERKEIRATVVRSGSHGLATPVARNNRILARTPTFQGYFWETFDFLTSTRSRNVIANFLNIKEEAVNKFKTDPMSGADARTWLKRVRKERLNFRDAGEWIASLPNGLQFYALTNAKDDLLNEADIKVAYDSTAHDFRVINGRSCIWCHTDGIRPFRSQFQLQVGRQQLTDLGIFTRNIEHSLALADFIRRTFGAPDFAEYIREDQQRYNKFVQKANGLTAERNAPLFRTLWDGYAEVDLDTNRLCYELGVQPTVLRALIALRKDGVNNGVLLQQMLKPPIAIRRDHWEEVFPDIAILTTLLKAKKP